jgi:rhodanese-related sulfurtransferase
MTYSSSNDLWLQGYTNVDWVGGVDAWKSTSDYIFLTWR